MKQFTIVRNGTIRRKERGTHWCGWARTARYPYRGVLTVEGELQGPDFFVVANEEIDEWIQAFFADRETESCEKMCDDILNVTLGGMKKYPQWSMVHIRTEITGTQGVALLSCEWHREEVSV